MLHQEFSKYVVSDLSRPFTPDSYHVMNEENLTSLTLGILRLKSATFIDLCKDEIFIYVKSTIKQTICEYIAYIDEDQITSYNDENGPLDQVRLFKIQEFLHLLSKVLSNVRNILMRSKSIVSCIQTVIDTSAISRDSSCSKELITKASHTKFTNALKDLSVNAGDYTQERLVNLLEHKFRDNGLDKLSLNDFISLTNLTDQFILDFDSFANKKTSTLRSWIQTQVNKFRLNNNIPGIYYLILVS